MRRPAEKYPVITITERPGKPVSIRVDHYGRVPNLLGQFSDDVLRRAVNKGRTRREHQILKAARRLSRTAYRIVENHLIYERCLKVQEQHQRRTSRPIAARRIIGVKSVATARPGVAFEAPKEEALTLTQILARAADAAPAAPRRTPDRGRGR